MDDLSRKLRSVDWKSLQKSARRMQQSTASALKDLVMTDLENKTRSATSDTPWGASTTDLQAIAQGTYNRDDYALIMSIVWQRLASTRWRCVYKALEVLKYLLMHGSSRCLEEARSALGHIETLRMYRKVEGGRDVGEGVRMRAEGIVEMLRDDAVLQTEREKSEQLRRKMVGGGEATYGSGYGGSSSRYDDTPGDAVSSRVGTSSFSGYDDQPGQFRGYDDDPAALKGYAQKQHDGVKNDVNTPGVDDLLGGDQVDDDDEFDPRAATHDDNNTHTEHVGELFGALTLVDRDNPTTGASNDAVSNITQSAGTESTSALVARLAAEKTAGAVVSVPQQGATLQPRHATTGIPHGGSVWDDNPADSGAPTTNGNTTLQQRLQPGTGIWAETPQAATQQQRMKPMITKKEEDAFSDLLATARKTVL